MPTDREFRCANCFHVTDGAEFCSTFCIDQFNDWESSEVVYPVDGKRPRLELVS